MIPVSLSKVNLWGGYPLANAMLSVLIVNWNSRDELRDCLASLRQFPPRQSHEIIVVDNQSTDGSTEMIAAEFPEIMLVQPGANTGYARGNNLAFAQAKGDWLLTLNPDTIIPSGALDLAINRLESIPTAGVLSVRFIGIDGKTQRSVRGFPTLIGILGDLTGLGALFPQSALGSYRLVQFDYQKSQFAPQPMGTYLLFRRAALAAIGDPSCPFDEQFPIFFNEVDLLKRLSNAGWKCWYAADISITHVGGVSTRQVRKAMIWESHRSLMRYLDKHQKSARFLLPFVGLLVSIGALIRARGFSEGFRP